MSESDTQTWTAHPPNSAHVYHTEKEGIARIWQERDGLRVEPAVEPYPEGTMGHYLYGDSDTDKQTNE